MRHFPRFLVGATGLAIGLSVPTLAHAQAPVPSPEAPRLNLRLHLNPSTFWQPSATVIAPADASRAPRTPRVKPNGPVFIRAFGGFITGETTVPITGFLIGGGIAVPLGPRDAMELQVDLSFTRYTGGSEYRSFDLHVTYDYVGRVVAPTALFIFNFVQDGRKVVPFIGGGLIFMHVAETDTSITDWPYHLRSVSTSTTLFTGPQGVGGVQFVSSSRATFRLEGRVGLTRPGILVAVFGGVSF